MISTTYGASGLRKCPPPALPVQVVIAIHHREEFAVLADRRPPGLALRGHPALNGPDRQFHLLALGDHVGMKGLEEIEGFPPAEHDTTNRLGRWSVWAL